MTEQDLSREKLIEKLSHLHQEITSLKVTERVFLVQNELMRSFVTMAKTATGSLMLRSLSQQILNKASQLTHADESNLLLLDSQGKVSESVGTRMASLIPPSNLLVGKVPEGGIVGWVMQNRQIGLISDTTHDDRWKPLPGYSNTIRSVLCIPIFRGHTILAVLTLMHCHPSHFRYEAAHLMKLMAEPIGSILESALLLVKTQGYRPIPNTKPGRSIGYYPDRHNPGNVSEDNPDLLPLQNATIERDLSSFPKIYEGEHFDSFSNLGLYIIRREGKFLYANHKLAELFGYSFEELLEMESLLAIVTKEDFDWLFDEIEQCIQGQTKNISCQFQGQRKDGQRISVELCGSRTKLYGKSAIIGAVGEIAL